MNMQYFKEKIAPAGGNKGRTGRIVKLKAPGEILEEGLALDNPPHPESAPG